MTRTLALLSMTWISATHVATAQPAAGDTIHLEVGSPEIDGRVFPPHSARNRTYVGEGGPPVSTWTNDLTVGDSAGTQVHRWVSRGVGLSPEGNGVSWELHQTYDSRTLAPLTYYRWSDDGRSMRLRIDGTRVRGEERLPGESQPRTIDRTIDRRGFFAGASDLVPMAIALRPGLVVTAPVWAPAMERTQVRVFTVLGREALRVEGDEVTGWKIEERIRGDDRILATWYVTDVSPFMLLAESTLADGRRQRITGVALDGPR
jgi:hypothetical protein